jgi:hypothetical protein
LDLAETFKGDYKVMKKRLPNGEMERIQERLTHSLLKGIDNL